jgi:TPR repeat protein
MNKTIIEQSYSLWQSGQDLEAISLLKPLVAQGNTEAKAYLGMYLISYHKDNEYPYLKEGIALLQEASDEGNPSATHNIGTIYLGGTPFIKKDRKKAAIYYLKARELGENLGLTPIAGSAFYKEWEEEINNDNK